MKKLVIGLSACALLSLSGMVMAEANSNPAPAVIHLVADDQQAADANKSASNNSAAASQDADQTQQQQPTTGDDQSSSDSDADYE